MLQNIREKSHGVIAWIIVGIIIATFALWGIHSYATDGKSSGVIAKVNGATITTNDINMSYQRLRQQQEVQLGANFSLNQNAEMQLKKQALQQLIISNVLINAANHKGYRVTTSQVNEALLQIPAFQVDGQFSPARFNEILNSILYSESDFIADMRESMLVNQVQGGYINSAFALPNDVDTTVRLVNEKRDISYTIIPSARFAHEVTVSPSDVQIYYQSHQSEFQSPEQVSLAYIELSLPAIKSGLHFDKTKIQQYYETHLQNYTRPTSWHVAQILLKLPDNPTASDIDNAMKKAQDIESKLKAGEEFSALAKQYSEDSISASVGGALSWFVAGSKDPDFETAVGNLKNPGDYSAPIKTKEGITIIQLLGKKPSHVIPFSEARSQVEEMLADQQAQQIFADLTDKLSNITYANPNSLEAASKSLNLPIQTTDFFGREGGKNGITANPRVIAAAFSDDVLKQNNNSDVIQLDPNTDVVIRVKQHKAASILPLTDAQGTIETQLRNKAAEQKTEQFGQDLLKQLQSGAATPESLATKYALPWQNDHDAGRYDPRIDGAVLAQAFRLPHPAKDTPSVDGLSLASGDYALIMVNGIKEGFLPPDDKIQRRIFTEEIEKSLGNLDYELYVKQLMKEAKIKVNTNAFEDADNDNNSAI